MAKPNKPQMSPYHTYETNPVPWFITTIWVAFLLGGVAYLIINLSRG